MDGRWKTVTKEGRLCTVAYPTPEIVAIMIFFFAIFFSRFFAIFFSTVNEAEAAPKKRFSCARDSVLTGETHVRTYRFRRIRVKYDCAPPPTHTRETHDL